MYFNRMFEKCLYPSLYIWSLVFGMELHRLRALCLVRDGLFILMSFILSNLYNLLFRKCPVSCSKIKGRKPNISIRKTRLYNQGSVLSEGCIVAHHNYCGIRITVRLSEMPKIVLILNLPRHHLNIFIYMNLRLELRSTTGLCICSLVS